MYSKLKYLDIILGLDTEIGSFIRCKGRTGSIQSARSERAIPIERRSKLITNSAEMEYHQQMSRLGSNN
jgi:hypothetical protein